MNFVQQLEESLRDLAAEARKQHPGVKEASERATLKLRQQQNAYIAALRQANQTHTAPPTTAVFQSSELLHPFLLAANYPNASTRLLEISFHAMKLLIQAHAIVPSDCIHMVRVWMIQAQVVAQYYHKQYTTTSSTAMSAVSTTSSGWFGSWGASSSSSSSTLATTGGEGSTTTTTTSAKNAVSSSSGQTGSSHQSPAAMEKMAKDILSCLIQLLESMDSVSDELWTNAIALACLWLFLPSKHTVYEAARSTVLQVVDALYNATSTKLLQPTWYDFLALASSKQNVTSAFVLCKKSSSGVATNLPSPEFALELMAHVWKRTSPWANDKLVSQTLGVTVALLREIPKAGVEKALRTMQWTHALFVTLDDYPNECKELLQVWMAPIVAATDACRSHHDFEDGYVYAAPNEDSSSGNKKRTTLISLPILWKAALCFESLFTVAVDPVMAEVWSDFLTICASCRSHMLQLVEFTQNHSANYKPSLMRRAEQAIAAGNKSFDEDLDGPSPLGEALWMGLLTILKMAEQPWEEAFAPCLAVLQHFLKRFVACNELVEVALKGYWSLTNTWIHSPLQRKALLTSLCKLSLPMWGKHDTSCQLQNNHIQSLLMLFRIIHRHYDNMEWDIVLWTLEELSQMAIASPLLSNESYHAALAVSAVFERFAAFSTCFSTESLLNMAEALTDIAKSAMAARDVVGDNDTVLAQRTAVISPSSTPSEHEGKGIGEKIMNIGVRAIYGNSGGDTGERVSEELIVERTKNSFYEEYRRDFVHRLSTTKSPVRVTSIGRIPLSVALLTDVIMANSFRSCGDDFADMLSALAASSPAVRPFAMDLMSMLTMTKVASDRGLPINFVGPGKLVFADPMQSQIWAVEKMETDQAANGPNGKSQSQILAPICHTIRTTEKVGVAESTLGALTSILEGVGHNLNGDVWSDVIDSVASLSGDPTYTLDRTSAEWSGTSSLAFRSLKFIVDDFLDQLSSSDNEPSSGSVGALLECCSSFGRSQHDVNTSLTAIGLLWTIADQDSGPESIERALSKLKMLASDPRAEVRNASVNTLFSCIVGRGATFSPEQWQSCFADTVFGVYDLVASKVKEGDVDASRGAEKASRYKVSLHHSRDSATKQWIATQVVVLRGLIRVLRNFFSQLLDTTDVASNTVPWLQEAWAKILTVACEAAKQDGGRESIDICSVGVELLVLCCQLTSKAGVSAAMTPARVGTNMEVVNGALRSVRETHSTKVSYERSHSAVTESSRENLFLDSFNALDEYREALENVIEGTNGDSPVDDSSLQVLHKFAGGLTQLYEGSKEGELAPFSEPEKLFDFEEGGSEASFEARFVRIVGTVVAASTVDPKARFLNQSQRCALALLRTMIANGSLQAYTQLISLAGVAFFLKRSTQASDVESSDACGHQLIPSLVGVEASSVVAEEISKEGVRDEYKAFVLYKVLLLVSSADKESPQGRRLKRYYKSMVPVASVGLAAASRLGESGVEKPVGMIWSILPGVLTEMMTPVPIGGDMVKISRVSEVSDILKAASQYVPSSFSTEMSTILSFGASKASETGKLHSLFLSRHDEGDTVQKSKKQRDELLDLFRFCYAECCSMKPNDPLLRSIARQVLDDALPFTGEGLVEPKSSDFTLQTALTVVRAMKENRGTEPLILSVFPSLCKLLSGSDPLKTATADLFDAVDLSTSLENTQARCEAAERRAESAERRVEELTKLVDVLKRKNDTLRQEVAILEASSVM